MYALRNRIAVAALLLLAAVTRAQSPAVVYCDQPSPMVRFGIADITAAFKGAKHDVAEARLKELTGDARKHQRLVITHDAEVIKRLCDQYKLAAPKHTAPQSYAARVTQTDAGQTCFVLAADPVGAMYGAMDIAEQVRFGQLAQLKDSDHTPYIAKRGIKFNIPLDLRTPSYSDCSDAAQQNIPEMWSMEFWQAMLDDMARHRFNVLTLWSLHPFPSIVKVPEYPEVALNDVWRTTLKLDDTFSFTGTDMVRPAMLEKHEVVKRMTIEQKIQFWRDVMQHAHDRGIEVHWFTWNMFTFGAQGKHGITGDQGNPVTLDYFRCSVRETVLTYPLLAGIGITAGENLKARKDEFDKEQWLYKAYGLGVADALKKQPGRQFRVIHRYHMTGQEEILRQWKDLPCPMDLSFKYAIAHMYSIPNPPFAKKSLEELPADRRMWMTVRNDDIYSFRWGDPEYARAFIKAMPGPDKLAGYYMGPDGYIWGREFISTEPETPRELVIQKQWYSFLIWGRLSYEPELPKEFFWSVVVARYREGGTDLFDAVADGSRVIPQVTRFFWGDIDLKWFPEACLSHLRHRGFYTVRDFVNGQTMPGSGIINIRSFVDRKLAGEEIKEITPEKVAYDVIMAAGTQGHSIERVRRRMAGREPEKELRLLLGDCQAMHHLGWYYGRKIQAATKLGFYDRTGNVEYQQLAVTQLQDALEHWKKYAAVATRQYKPQLLNRVGYVDLNELTKKVEQDIEIARTWKPAKVEAKP